MKRMLSFFSISLFLIGCILSEKALALDAGTYLLRIEPTPWWGAGTSAWPVWYDSSGRWNSSFTFGTPR